MNEQPEEQPFPFLFVEPVPWRPRRAAAIDTTALAARISGPRRPTGVRDKVLVIDSWPVRDAQADELVAELAIRGTPAVYLHTRDALRTARLALRAGPDGESRGTIVLPAGELALDEVRAVWCRGMTGGAGVVETTQTHASPAAPEMGAVPALSGDAAAFARREMQAALEGLAGLLDDALWVNTPQAVRRAQDKLGQLRAARALGFTVPRTLVTNDPAAARAFFETCGGEMILKTFTRLAGFTDDGGERLILTHRVTREHLEQADLVRHAPCLFQEYVPKDVELRVTLIGDQVFTAEIHSQRGADTRDDYRRYDDPARHAPCVAGSLPPALEAACRRLAAHYGLLFAALDLIRRPDGTHVFLEINPDAQYLWVQDLTGLPIRQALAELLAGGTR